MSREDRPRPQDAPKPMSLFDSASPPILVKPDPGTIDDSFDRFHSANPWVYDALVELARDLHRRGRGKVGMKMLFEVLRWHWYMSTTDESSDFKLNNNYTSRYARLIMKNESDLEGIFEIRTLTS